MGLVCYVACSYLKCVHINHYASRFPLSESVVHARSGDCVPRTERTGTHTTASLVPRPPPATFEFMKKSKELQAIKAGDKAGDEAIQLQCTHTHTHTHTHMYTHTHTHTPCIHTYTHTRVYTYTCTHPVCEFSCKDWEGKNSRREEER